MNLEDSSMTLLRGHFAMTLICAGEASAAEVESALQPLVDESLDVTVREVPREPTSHRRSAVSGHGARRRPARASWPGWPSVIADAGGNITDLTTRLAGGLYVLIAEVDLPTDVRRDALRREITRSPRNSASTPACVRSSATTCESGCCRRCLAGRVRDVVRAPDHVLSIAGDRADPSDPDVVQLCADLVATMRVSPGCVGLAAPQIGVSAQAFCVDVSAHPKARTTHGLIVVVNAEVVEASRNEKGREGCMSVPELTGDVKRATRITVGGQLPGTGRDRDHDRRLRSPSAAARDRPLRRPAVPGSGGWGARRPCPQGLSRSASQHRRPGGPVGKV